MWVLTALALGLVFLWRWRCSGHSMWAYLVLTFARSYASLWHRWRPLGPFRPPRHGPAILYANHTCSPDATFLQAGCERTISYLIAGDFYGSRFSNWLFPALHSVPVQRGCHDVRAARLALRGLAAGRLLGIFPEGGLSSAGRGRLGLVRSGVAWLALRSRAPVYPAWISGGPQTHILRRAWFRPARRPVRVRYGPPVDLSPYYGRPINRRLLEEVMQLLMEHLTALAPKRPQSPGGKHEYGN